jgi:Carboxypeptidase regulatory-like domain/TonB dependent receptor
MSPRNPARVSLLSHRARRFDRFLPALLFAVCPVFGGALVAQVNTGRILGTITDQTGGVIAGAMVTVTNTGTGVARTLTTNQSGEYAAPDLIPGSYSVRVSDMGFQNFERQNIALGVGQSAQVDAQLPPGQVTQTVEVSAAAPLINTTNAVVSGTLEAQTIGNLPMNGRNFQNLLTLQAGVVSSPGGGTLTTSTNGLQPQDNNYVYEGLDGNDPYSGQSITNTTLPFGDAATILPADAIQELNIETNAPAEFGRRPGAVINIGIKSGTNTIHGTAFAFGRDGAWDARDFLNPPSSTPPEPLELEQYGASVGGPILKNKLFYFGSFERQTYNVGTAFTEKIPTTALTSDASVSIPAAENALATAGIPLNPLSVSLLPQFGANSGTSSSIGRGFPYVFAINNGVGKLDYHLNDHHALSGSYYRGEGNGLGEDATRTQSYFRSLGNMTSSFLTTSWTWTPNSNWVNDLRFGWNLFERIDNVADFQTPATTYGINTGVSAANLQGFPTISVSGFTALGGDSRAPKDSGPGNDYDIVDHVSFLHGHHDFQFGGEILTFRAFFDEISLGRGNFQFNGGTSQPITGTISTIASPTALEAFLAGVPKQAQILQGSPARNFRQSGYSGFFEDTWRVRPRLTLDLGLRYEYFTPLAEKDNLIGTWDPTVGFQQVGVNVKSAYNPDSRNFSPRVGVAWDVTGKGTTVLHVGAGIYYTNIIIDQLANSKGGVGRAIGISAIPTAYSLFAANGAVTPPLNPTNGIGAATATIPANLLNWNPPPAQVLPASGASSFVCGDGIAPINPVAGAPKTNPSPCSILFTPPSLPSPRVYGWNLGIEHAFSSNLSFKANYVGNHGTRLPGLRNLNQLNPNSPGELAFACGKPVGTQNHCELPQDLPYFSSFPYLFGITELTDSDISYYNGLQLSVTTRTFHNLTFNAGYTYSHSLSDLPGGDFHSAVPQDSLHPLNDYGAAQFDIRHHFGLTLTYNIPGMKSPAQMLKGWVISSAIVLQSGLPYEVLDSQDRSATNQLVDRWDFFGNPSNFKATGNPIPFYKAGDPSMPAACTQAFNSAGGAATLANGCYAKGNSVMISPALGQFGTMSRNMFYDSGYHNWDFSIFKNWTIKERLTAQFRAEFFNILNLTNYANPNLAGTNDPSGGQFGCGCETPDVANTNPVLGSGAAREIQLGLKLLF